MWPFKKKKLKFCVGCKWYRKQDYYDYCEHIDSADFNVITGDVQYHSCSYMRAVECGERARLFEPKVKTMEEVAASVINVDPVSK